MFLLSRFVEIHHHQRSDRHSAHSEYPEHFCCGLTKFVTCAKTNLVGKAG